MKELPQQPKRRQVPVLRGAGRWWREARDWPSLIALTALVLVTRVPMIPEDPGLSKDGPSYMRALALGEDFSVPPPGNIGFVLAGRLITEVTGVGGVQAYAILNIFLVLLGCVATYFVARLWHRPGLSLALAACLSTNTFVWIYSLVISSYPVWLAVFPAVALFGLRLLRFHRNSDVIWLSLSLAVGIFMRPDLVAFGGPFLFYCLVKARVGLGWKILAGTIVAAGAVAFVLTTAWILGSVQELLARVAAKHQYHESFGLAGSGVVEGLARNSVKFFLFLAWGSPLAVALAGVGLWRGMFSGSWRSRDTLALAILVIPPLWFALGIFMGTPGLVFPVLFVLMLLCAQGILGKPDLETSPARVRKAASIVLLVGAVSVLQFVAVRPVEATNQRDAILNVMFLRYSAAALEPGGKANLSDYGIESSLANTVRQLWNPEPLPTLPTSIPAFGSNEATLPP